MNLSEIRRAEAAQRLDAVQKARAAHRRAVLLRADARLSEALTAVAHAAAACLRGAFDAAVQVRVALALIGAAREVLAPLADEAEAEAGRPPKGAVAE